MHFDLSVHFFGRIVFDRYPLETTICVIQRTIPDVVLLNVFKYLHPVDLVNGASYVSKRWNLLAKTPSLYRHVRVLVNKQSVKYESAKEFLQRVILFSLCIPVVHMLK